MKLCHRSRQGKLREKGLKNLRKKLLLRCSCFFVIMMLMILDAKVFDGFFLSDLQLMGNWCSK